MSCGFTTSATVSALRGGLEVGDDGDAVPLLELAGALGALLADEQVVDAAAGADQAGEQGLAHDSGAEDRRSGPCVAPLWLLLGDQGRQEE